MSNNNLMVLSTDQQKVLNDLRLSIPVERQLSWLQLSNLKLNIEQKLEAKVLELQEVLSGWDTMKLLDLSAALEKSKVILGEVPEIRKSFTRYLDGISDQMMGIEKRAKGLEALAKATQRELDLRLETEKTNDEATAKAQEASNFKTHVQNEYIRISTEYKTSLLTVINNSYIAALETPLTDDGLMDHMQKLAVALKAVPKSSPTKFNYTKHQPAELNEIVKTIPAPNHDETLTKAVGYISERFKLYHQDVQNAEMAKAKVKESTQQTAAELNQKAQQDQAVNSLVNKGESVIVDTLPGSKKVKRKYVIVPQDTAEDTKRIISAFIANWSDASAKLKVKSWVNLSVKQMAAALQELDEQLPGLVYQEVVK